MSDQNNSRDEKVDGAAIAASIINAMAPDKRKKIVAAIEKASPDTAVKLGAKLYSITRLLSLNTLDLQVLFSHISLRDVIISLKLADEKTKEHILSAFSDRKKAEIMGEFSMLPPMRKKDVLAACKRIMDKLAELESKSVIREKSFLKSNKAIMSKLV